MFGKQQDPEKLSTLFTPRPSTSMDTLKPTMTVTSTPIINDNTDTDTTRVLPLCSSCTTTTPNLNALLSNPRIQHHLTQFNQAMATIDWVSYSDNTASPVISTSTTNPTQPLNVNLKQEAVDHDLLINEKDHPYYHQASPSGTTTNIHPCTLCAAKRAIPLLTSLLQEIKSLKKESASQMSKAQKKALKREIKEQAREMKKSVKKEIKGNRNGNGLKLEGREKMALLKMVRSH